MNARRFRVAALALLLAALAVWTWRAARPAAPDSPDPPAADSAAPARPQAFRPYRPAQQAAEPVQPPAAVALPASSPHAIPGEYTLFFADAAAMDAFLAQAAGRGLQVLGSLPEFLSVRVGGGAEALRPLLQEGMTVDLNYRIGIPAQPDPGFWQSGRLAAFGNRLAQFLGAPGLDSRGEWGRGVTVAVLDTGALPHPALGAVREIDLADGATIGQFASHGTAVAGLVASTSALAPGIAPGVSILAVRVLDADGSGDAFTLAEGILAAVRAGADVINMSLGGYGDAEILRRAVAYAAANGVVMVASVGNDGLGTVTFPAAYPAVIGVTAVDALGNRAPFANFGPGVDLAAPGYQINALWQRDDYAILDGTSAAAPLVAGMAARILESGAATTADQVRQLLLAEANEAGPPGPDAQYGAGILSTLRIESAGQPGIRDMAVADLYPALEEMNSGLFPLYVTFQNRGTELIPDATAEILVNGTPYQYRFSGIARGEVRSVSIPVPVARLESAEPFRVSARITLSGALEDSRPANDEGSISLSLPPAP